MLLASLLSPSMHQCTNARPLIVQSVQFPSLPATMVDLPFLSSFALTDTGPLRDRHGKEKNNGRTIGSFSNCSLFSYSPSFPPSFPSFLFLHSHTRPQGDPPPPIQPLPILCSLSLLFVLKRIETDLPLCVLHLISLPSFFPLFTHLSHSFTYHSFHTYQTPTFAPFPLPLSIPTSTLNNLHYSLPNN